MADSDLSASELRARYAPGGSAGDSELSAAQLRARHAVPSNSQDFSTREQNSGGDTNIVAVSVVAFAVIALLYYVFAVRLVHSTHDEL
jgi:hypothetical protein